MKVKFINKFGGTMFVDETRVEEYKGAGFKLAPTLLPKEEPTEEVKAKPAEKKAKRTK